ncbi:unnamed protein product [Microthlaspi erraticum]|uniref:Uncharacterized protein n=1 Tax=Microthlaspi erraticum TaxID=1685480 RepID=A0A6D2HQJ4_9BRAS|nr:unnamed protein product [Microthlaspi erraticum]
MGSAHRDAESRQILSWIGVSFVGGIFSFPGWWTGAWPILSVKGCSVPLEALDRFPGAYSLGFGSSCSGAGSASAVFHTRGRSIRRFPRSRRWCLRKMAPLCRSGRLVA